MLDKPREIDYTGLVGNSPPGCGRPNAHYNLASSKRQIAQQGKETTPLVWVGVSRRCYALFASPTLEPTYTKWMVSFSMSTSKLQRYTSHWLSVHLGQYTIRENTRPDWLIMPDGARLELDFYIEELETAIEIQGAQHYVYTPHFHKDYNDFKRQVERDRFKRRECAEMGISLLEASNIAEVNEIVLKLSGIKVEYAMHPNAVKQQREIKKRRRKEKRSMFGMYPNTIKKHLAKMRKVLIKIERGGIITQTHKHRLHTGVKAISQYQEATKPIRFGPSAKWIIREASRVIGL